MKMTYDVIVIGTGPAGISSSLYLKRGNLKVAVISKRDSTLLDAEWIENYYGFPGGISGIDLLENGVKQALKLGVDIFNDEVLEIDYNGNFGVKTVKNEFEAKALVLSTGSKKNKINIEGIEDFNGKGISYCAICDGFFFKDKKLGVLGNKQYALHEINVLKNITSDITLFTNGLEVEFDEALLENVKVETRKIEKLTGEGKLENIVFQNEKQEIDGLFIALGSAQTSELALKIGLITENNKIKVNEKMETNIPGLYACGDAVKGLQQISKAVYEGSVAGVEIVKYLKNKK